MQIHYAVLALLSEFTFYDNYGFGDRVFQEMVILFNLFSVISRPLKRAISNIIIPAILDPRELEFCPFVRTFPRRWGSFFVLCSWFICGPSGSHGTADEDVHKCVFLSDPSIKTQKFLAVKREDMRMDLERQLAKDPLLADRTEATVDLVPRAIQRRVDVF